ncbi:hypothetical protein GR212_15745 [Rhizobium lusitanum]|uniref:Uncharacterized protein n=1 Tax=Rhizobium lusitanum TaxID=293958 RepID=A0A6L9U9N7_9HYPH|nr:hypothetical protein [Rhizobium lusitanum]NEI71032.1 hypothetical protein [Rhizobium lusitanum]
MSDILAKKIVLLLVGQRLPVTDEKGRLQPAIAEALKAADVSFKREHRLDAHSIIDFLIDGVGIEVKVKGSKLNIFRQVERYAGFDEINTLILVTNVPMGMPPLVNGKPVYIVNLAKAWL